MQDQRSVQPRKGGAGREYENARAHGNGIDFSDRAIGLAIGFWILMALVLGVMLGLDIAQGAGLPPGAHWLLGGGSLVALLVATIAPRHWRCRLLDLLG